MFKKPIHMESTSQVKAKRILFRPLSDKSGSTDVATSVPVTKSPCEDILESSKSLSEEWTTVYPLFSSLDKFDHASLSSYSDTELEKKCAAALDFFHKATEALCMASLSGKTLKDDLVKIFIICFYRATNELLAYISEEENSEPPEKALKRLATLNAFLLLMLQDRKNPAILAPHDVTLMQIISEALNAVHEKLANSTKKDVSSAAYFLYYLFQALAMLTALNEGRNFMKSAANDAIKFAFEAFEISLRISISHPILKEVYGYPLGEGEKWEKTKEKYVKASVGFDKKKFSVIQIVSDLGPPKFTLRYINLYYALKIIQLLIPRKIPGLDERVLEIIAIQLKDMSECLEMKTSHKNFPLGEDIVNVENVLNQNLACFNIIKRILPCVGDPFSILDKCGYTRFLKVLTENHLSMALRFQLAAVIEQSGGSDVVENMASEVSYKLTHDYISGVFNFLNRLKNANTNKAVKTPIKTSKASISSFVEEIMGEIINRIDTVQSSSANMTVFKAYIVEYLFDNKCIVSKQTAEYIIRLVESKAFHFTSPEVLKGPLPKDETVESAVETLTNKRIVILLNEIMAYDKAWAETIWHHLIGQIKTLFEKDEECMLFGLFKLIYCSLTNEVHSNYTFYSRLFDSRVSKVLDYKAYVENEPKGESKSVKAFIDVKGIYDIISMIQASHHKSPEPKSIVKMTEQLLLELIRIPSISEQILKQQPPSVVVEFLECAIAYPHVRDVTFDFLQTLLAVVKYNQRMAVVAANDKSSYLPLTVLDFIKTRGKEDNVKSMIPFIELLINFVVAREVGAPSIVIHQTILNKSMSLDFLFQILNSNSNTPLVGKILGLFLKFLGRLQTHNDQVAADISNSSLISTIS